MPDPGEPSAAVPVPQPAANPRDRSEAVVAAVATAVGLMTGSLQTREFAGPVLRLLGEASGVSRAYLFEFQRKADGRYLVTQRYEWTAPGISAQIDNPDLQGLDLIDAGYGRWQETLLRGEPIFGEIAEFPPSERPILEAQQILSLLVQPIFAGARIHGMIGFDACSPRAPWDRFEVSVLRIAAQAWGAAVLREERDAQLRHMQRMEAMGRMAGGVAHDFNNVLTVVGGAVEALQGEAAGPAPSGGDRYGRILRQALDQGRGLTRRLLEFSRPGAGQARELDLGEAVARAVPLLRQAAGSRVRVEVERAPAPRVRIDPVQLEQVLLNLVINSRDAMAEGGRVRVEVGPGPAARAAGGAGVAQLRVTDNGPGIPEELRDRVFEPFFTTKAERGGTGLGLSTVYAIVTSHGGTIALGPGTGGGAEFLISLPAAG
ncbi:MAG: GAF domain-containing protein [Verrucomicrobia bacterium]|nr:GAF domain-containing protein [Verrucomicrobiota bacterium]